MAGLQACRLWKRLAASRQTPGDAAGSLAMTAMLWSREQSKPHSHRQHDRASVTWGKRDLGQA